MSVHASSFKEGYFHVNGQWKITAHHDIREVTPTMIDWWWDHIDTTERYRFWHPTDHVSFEWIISPQQAGGHVGPSRESKSSSMELHLKDHSRS